MLELLKKAEILTERDLPGRAVTFNNLACYYRRQGKLHAALQYLQKALKIEGRLEHVDNPADTCGASPRRRASSRARALSRTEELAPPFLSPRRASLSVSERYLNACAVLSQLGRHQSALEHSQQALILLQEELSRVVGPMATDDAPPRADRIAVPIARLLLALPPSAAPSLGGTKLRARARVRPAAASRYLSR